METTKIEYVKVNNTLVAQDVTLKQDEELVIQVEPNSTLEIVGMYEFGAKEFRKMPKMEKLRLLRNYVKRVSEISQSTV